MNLILYKQILLKEVGEYLTRWGFITHFDLNKRTYRAAGYSYLLECKGDGYFVQGVMMENGEVKVFVI